MAWFRRHRWVALAGLAVVGLTVLTLTLSTVSAAQMRAWEADCASQGGHVEREPRHDDNHPILTQSTDPVYRCLSAEGALISVRP